MEATGVSFPKKRAGVGALVGLAVGAFAALPWGSFAGADSPGVWLAAPLMLAFVLIGGWFGTVVSLSDADSAAAEHNVSSEGHEQAFGDHHGHPTPA
jgi:hypothetical protein